MSYSEKIAHRQIVNFNADLGDFVVSRVNQQVPLNLRFVPDCVIVRQIVYTADSANQSRLTAQIYCDLALDQIIGSFPLGTSTANPNVHFPIRPNFQNGTVNFQIQLIPTSGVGLGQLLTPIADFGELSVILEFIQYERHIPVASPGSHVNVKETRLIPPWGPSV